MPRRRSSRPPPPPASSRSTAGRPVVVSLPPIPYLERTRHGIVNLMFLMPFLLIYLLCWWSVGDGVETQAAASLREFLRLLGRKGLFVVTLCTSLALCAVVLLRIRGAKADVPVFGGMIAEGVAYGFLLDGVARALTAIAPVGDWLGIGLLRWPTGLPQVRSLGIAVGAGIFEELLFRGVICYAAFRALRTVLGADRVSSGAVAVVLSAALFSAYHHWGAGGEPWDAYRFTFRFHAGVLLGAVFLTRGLGIAAFAHGFYDALILLS